MLWAAVEAVVALVAPAADLGWGAPWKTRATAFGSWPDSSPECYAGLSSFARLRPDLVKFDISIVQDVHRDEAKRRLIAGMIRLCHDMQVDVVAEGVQSDEERSIVIDLGCDLFQGFLFAKPAARFPKVTW